MNILVVGNVIKDVYLNMDPRAESYEEDARGVKWLDLSFDASEHHFFSRVVNYGGAAVSLEALQRLGLNASVSGLHLDFLDTDESIDNQPQMAHRYILIADGQVCYMAPSSQAPSDFEFPVAPVDYLYIDRSAVMTEPLERRLIDYLNNTPQTKLVMYACDIMDTKWERLLRRASLIFVEKHKDEPAISDAPSSGSAKTPAPKDEIERRLQSYDAKKLVYLCENSISYIGIKEKLNIKRTDALTHLSLYSILAGTVLGCFVLGFPVKKSLRFARLNAENARLDSCLDRARLEALAEEEEKGSDLELIAANLVLAPKGILAADESGGSIHKKFEAMHIPDDYETRREYREMLITTENLNNYVNGVILFDETARQRVKTGETFTNYLTDRMIIPGIKVDQGLEKIDGSDETYTKGLDGLGERLAEYHEMGLRFAKWRAAFTITTDDEGKILTPTPEAIVLNAQILAEYAAECQRHGLVPIVEPEVVYDGDHSAETCARVTGEILDTLFSELAAEKVNLRACILKVNMVLAGSKFARASSAEEVGLLTANVLKTHVPRSLAGVVFLSGGQTPERATENLAAVLENGPFPWPVTFSFARALQGPALEAWAGKEENVPEAQAAFTARLIANQKALMN